ncbi:MAG: hypothetical protein C4543_03730 [Ignavibacteriales bacterium]|jgi:hypothetical protein|nr:MAG: hypothetical protein C4543_03730 [Ignavibacteriales bacterium]
MVFNRFLFLLIFFLLSINISLAQVNSDSTAISKILQHLEDINISGQWFLGFQSNDINNTKSNEFLLKRGYITFEKKFSKNFIGRITQDISVDQEGDGEGDVELRLKYGYLRYYADDFFIFTKPFIEFGLVHRPWIDFEQKINRYRVQGSMFLDRNDILSSADYGITITSLLGGEVDADYKKKVNKDYPGKYGSLTIGIYNGGGYHAIEKNQNKLFEGRLSIRPLPEYLTGLQLSYTKVFGKGNIELSPNFNLDLGSLSYENEFITLLFSYMKGEGNQSGNLYLVNNKNVSTEGYTLFSEIKFEPLSSSLFARYDFFSHLFEEKRMIVGIAYHFLESNKIMIDYDINSFNGIDLPSEKSIELAIELRF